MLDYYSDTYTYALAFSPLGHYYGSPPGSSGSSSSSSSSSSPSRNPVGFKLAIGSYCEDRTTSTSGQSSNHVTIVTTARRRSSSNEADDRDDDDGRELPGRETASPDEDQEMPDSESSQKSPKRASPQLSSIARAAHPYPPSAVAFSPLRLASTLQSSATTSSDPSVGPREMVASSSECLRLWDLVPTDGTEGTDTGSGSGFVGSLERSRDTGSKLVQRAVLANVSPSAFHVIRSA